jgi:hypothetical protein
MCDAQNHGEGWHVLTAFNLSHVRSFYTGSVSQGLLANPISGTE